VKKAKGTLEGHSSIFPLHAFTIASHIVKCPLSMTPFALELYTDIFI
jgi:hypothetical protein